MTEGVHLFGIRHHGPGSARSLARALAKLKPDIVLIEGPPDANDLIELAKHAEIEPPVALLVYALDSPRSAVLYPFATYSPEWQAIQYALKTKTPVRFIDLPQAHRLAKDATPTSEAAEGATEAQSDSMPEAEPSFANDPLQPLAIAAGYSDTERWWNDLVEARSGDDNDVFAAVHEMMTVARETLSSDSNSDASPDSSSTNNVSAINQVADTLVERQREAFMRKCIRDAQGETFTNIAVVCGAFHTPALVDLSTHKADQAILKSLPKTKTGAAWVPWSYERLSYYSGYGAGIESPVWYELLWHRSVALGAEWLTRAARLLREEDIPISSAHVIEACRLAESLASLRARPVPGLVEYNDAALAVMVNGDALNMQLIARRWHFGDRLGKIPESFPASPLQQNLAAEQKRLRMPAKAEDKTYDLDLRENNDRERSHLLRRLRILDVEWGTPAATTASQRGTFHEVWQLRWQPEFVIALVAGSRLGHTIAQAATSAIVEQAVNAKSLRQLVELLENGLFADLPDAIQPLVLAIENQSATAADITQLLDALPPLVNVKRYGNVRNTDVELVDEILQGLVPRMLIALPGAATGLDDEATHALWEQLKSAQQSLSVLGDEAYLNDWHTTLGKLADNESLAALLAGYATRVLYDAHKIDQENLRTRLSLALSVGNDPLRASAWIEGFLAGSGTLLVHDETLRRALDEWLSSVSDDHFTQALPLLRRTFAHFPFPERRQIGQQIGRRNQPVAAKATQTLDFDAEAAATMTNLLLTIWQAPSSSPASNDKESSQ